MISPMPTYLEATRFTVGISIAIPATVLCINRRLYMLASPITTVPSQADKNREVIIDLVIGIGLPIIVMALGLSPNLSLRLWLIHIQSFSFKNLDLQFLKTMGVLNHSSLPGSCSLLYLSRQSSWKLPLVFMDV